MSTTPLSVMLWTLKGPIEKRMEVAAASGFDRVELVGEHLAWTEARMASILGIARRLRLRIGSLSCTPRWHREPVSMLDPEQRLAFLKQVHTAMLSCDRLNIHSASLVSGTTLPGLSWEAQYASLLEGAKRAGDIASRFGVTLSLSPLNNKIDHRGHFLADSALATRLCREANHASIGMIFNVYHEQVQSGNLTRSLSAALPYTQMIQIADNPGRRQPGTGEISFPSIYRFLKARAYAGSVVMEFLPLGDQQAVLTDALGEAKAILAN